MHAKALGWSEIEARGQLRTDKEEAIAANVRAEAKAKKLKGAVEEVVEVVLGR